MKIFKKILSLILWMIAAFALIAVGYYFAVTKDAEICPEKLLLPEKNVVLYDAENRPVKNVTAEFRQNVSFGDLPQKTVFAFVDAEDKRFFSHRGFDCKRIAKAAYNNFMARSFQQGASTISQQLIKNTHLSQEKTLKRKLREWKLTRSLERKYSKEEIMEKYLNVIYFGHNCFGLHAASAFYFGKTPAELDLADSAILAGLVKSPNNYSPFKNPENCKKRKASVLNAMLKNGNITEEEKRLAMEKPLPAAPVKNNGSEYLHSVFDELSALSEKYGFTVGGKIEIHTYLDPALQTELENLAENHSESDKTMAVLDAQTQGFKAYTSTLGDAPRLPGSVLKPLLVYAPALEKDIISPATPILDEKIDYNGYSPNNYDGVYHGYVSARECLSQSLNVPAVKLLESVGTANAVSYLKKMGLDVPQEDLSLALALGGMKKGFTLQNLLSAYSTFSNAGNFNNAAFISKIKIDGRETYRRRAQNTPVFSEETSYLLTDMLQTAAKTGTAKKLRSLPFQIAAKTGTVGTEKGNTDAYALSYTTRDVVGVWLGNADNSFIGYTGGGLPCNYLFSINDYLQKRYKETRRNIRDFPAPKGIVRVTLDKNSYYDTHTMLLADESAPVEYRFSELFKKQAVPSKTSDFFTNPSIITPKIQYIDKKIVISFDEKSPSLYQYKIDRYDYATHTTVYFGGYTSSFVDEDIADDKKYIYTVTPVYKDHYGQGIQLPAVTTGKGEPPPTNDKKILEKEWWNC